MNTLILNKYVIREIQKYLKEINFARTQIKESSLFAFLAGVKCATTDKCITFDVCIQKGVFSVNVYKYTDYDSRHRVLLKIYEDGIIREPKCRNIV